jgi:hypothetical protein
VSEFEPPANVPNRAIADDDLNPLLHDKPVVLEREGLPPAYRMRADRHYVDQMTAASAAAPVRLIGVAQLEPPAHVDPEALEPLARSIAACGILQPLLVRKRLGGYQVIAGQKRLAAAVAAGLKEVPCLVHQVGDADCAGLASAANLRGSTAPLAVASQTLHDTSALLGSVLSDLERIGAWGGLMRTTPADGSLYTGVGLDLIEAQVWRTSWTLKALAVVRTGAVAHGRQRSVAGVLDRIIDGFEPERRLRGLHIQSAIDGPASARVDDEMATMVLTGAILMMVEALRDHDHPAIDVRVSIPTPGAVGIDVKQALVAMPAETARAFSGTSKAGGSATLALWSSTLKIITANCHGTAELIVDEQRGSVLRCTLRAHRA